MYKVNRHILIGILFIAFSCNKDKPYLDDPVPGECYDFTSQGGSGTTVFSETRFQYKNPCFNPSNQNEMVYFYRDNVSGENKIIKYNFTTGVKTVLVNTSITTQFKWSKTGWIAYDKSYHIWKIKDNGDSLTQVTTTPGNLYPCWDTSGTNLYWYHSPNLALPAYVFKINTSTANMDTVFSDYAVFNDISSNNQILSKMYIGSSAYISKGDATASTITYSGIANLSAISPSNIEGLCWHPDGNRFYFTIYLDGLYEGNASTGQVAKIRDFCSSQRYTRISCSADGTKLIGERVDSYIEDPESSFWNIKQTSRIYLINLQNMEETLVSL